MFHSTNDLLLHGKHALHMLHEICSTPLRDYKSLRFIETRRKHGSERVKGASPTSTPPYLFSRQIKKAHSSRKSRRTGGRGGIEVGVPDFLLPFFFPLSTGSSFFPVRYPLLIRNCHHCHGLMNLPVSFLGLSRDLEAISKAGGFPGSPDGRGKK